jgi:hypothetical protein
MGEQNCGENAQIQRHARVDEGQKVREDTRIYMHVIEKTYPSLECLGHRKVEAGSAILFRHRDSVQHHLSDCFDAALHKLRLACRVCRGFRMCCV